MIAIVCAAGIGDALLMQISAAALQKLGYKTVTFSKHLPALSSWFPGFTVAEMGEPLETLRPFDAVLLQNDNTEIAKEIRRLDLPVYTFYGDYQMAKHGPLRPKRDACFNPALCMAENIAQATARLFPGANGLLDNGLVPPKHLTFGKYPKRIAIHRTSTSEVKNWPERSFDQLKARLQEDGWDPVFIDNPPFPTLADLAGFLYESRLLIGNDSGPGHLASNLGINTLIIGSSKEHLTYWRPGWRRGSVAHPPGWVNHFKLTRNNWKRFVSVNKVFKIFNKLKHDLL